MVLGICAVLLAARGGSSCASDASDARLHVREYTPDVVYRLKGYVGYQIDLEFEPGESFLGLGAGDLESLTFSAQQNHLFLKPRATAIETNLTVLTNRRTYHFDYVAGSARPGPALLDVMYALRFTYPPTPGFGRAGDAVERQLAAATDGRPRNLDYGYCGSTLLKPVSAWDDGVQTRLRFGPRQDLPAIFMHNDDGSESLVNFTIEAGEVIVHRVARQFIVRRGRLTGCIVNQGFSGGGERLESGTVTPAVERVTREVRQ
ncbi:MAG TPA: TrbG/VirB9 family P-type conjugative transfer protein [Steroidobacteraceae bacterium]